jgi:hypothetical protein
MTKNSDISERLAKRINAAHAATTQAAHRALEHARQAGDLLIEAKAVVPHGEWLPWLETNCPDVTERTAQAYMRVARRWPELEAKAQRVADLPIRQALALLADGYGDRDGERTAGHDLASVLAAAKDGKDDDELQRLQRELRVLERVIDLPDVSLENLAAIVQRVSDIQDAAFRIRISTLANLGVLLNWDRDQGAAKPDQSIARTAGQGETEIVQQGVTAAADLGA